MQYHAAPDGVYSVDSLYVNTADQCINLRLAIDILMHTAAPACQSYMYLQRVHGYLGEHKLHGSGPLFELVPR